jgi:hypothetical protein
MLPHQSHCFPSIFQIEGAYYSGKAYTQELCCEIGFVVSFPLCLLFLPPFVVENIYLFFLLFLWISFFSFLARG